MRALRPTNAAVRTMSAADRLHVDKNLVNFSGNCVTFGGRFVTIFVSLRNIKSYRIMAKEYDSAVVSPGGLREAVRRAGYDLLVEDEGVSPDALDEIQKKK